MSIPTVERRRFKVGKYDIIAHPIPNSAHMLRYTVFVAGKRIGATVSVPTESDCRFLRLACSPPRAGGNTADDPSGKARTSPGP